MRPVLLLLFLFLFFCAGSAAAQQADLTDKQKQCYANLCRQLGLNPSFAYQHRINVAAHPKLKKQGLDLQQMARRWHGLTPLEQVLLADFVVAGKVVGTEEAPANHQPFRMIYLVEIQENMTGKKLPRRIEVYSRSTAQGNRFFSFNNEPVLQMGEELLLYLNEVQLTIGSETKPAAPKPRFEQIALAPAPEETKAETKTVLVPAIKIPVRNGQLLDAYQRPMSDLKEFSRKAAKVAAINNRQKFASRNYCK